MMSLSIVILVLFGQQLSVEERVRDLGGLLEVNADSQIVGLRFGRAKGSLTDRDLSILSDVPQLKKLVLTGARISDKSIEHVRTLGFLEELILNDTPITDEFFTACKKDDLKTLTTLRIDHTGVTDESLRFIARLEKLTYLSLSNTRVSNDGLKLLKNAKSLRSLCLSHTNVGAQGIAHLNGLVDLEFLDCSFPEDEWHENVDVFSRNMRLRVLRLRHTSISEACLKRLPSTLEDLDLYHCKLGPVSAKELNRLVRLRRLNLGYCDIDDDFLLVLDKIKGISDLDIRGNPITDRSAPFFSRCPELTRLIAMETGLTDKSLDEVFRLRKLETFSSRDSQITTEGLGKLKRRFPCIIAD